MCCSKVTKSEKLWKVWEAVTKNSNYFNRIAWEGEWPPFFFCFILLMRAAEVSAPSAEINPTKWKDVTTVWQSQYCVCVDLVMSWEIRIKMQTLNERLEILNKLLRPFTSRSSGLTGSGDKNSGFLLWIHVAFGLTTYQGKGNRREGGKITPEMKRRFFERATNSW